MNEKHIDDYYVHRKLQRLQRTNSSSKQQKNKDRMSNKKCHLL